jgi:hypothetical protein
MKTSAPFRLAESLIQHDQKDDPAYFTIFICECWHVFLLSKAKKGAESDESKGAKPLPS